MDSSELAGIRALESFNACCIGLGYIAGAENAVIHYNHNAFASSGRITGNCYSVVQIGRTISRESV